MLKKALPQSNDAKSQRKQNNNANIGWTKHDTYLARNDSKALLMIKRKVES